ncbi:hypothetical protein BW14_02325 [Bifidobacterium sp. UTBIF-68]|uniref:hypothetical protein n=1 Tax=Bifidobacterium sp. UTBIF-68 TaxID=1465262 RepID=UPI00112BED45|nr:hypothetical protein [Bifidobacterium sp. UTBIF-68]TPF94325.1 hypothetical protein BW14_02325 [Bifidobacterium sp. UTBIF-68]
MKKTKAAMQAEKYRKRFAAAKDRVSKAWQGQNFIGSRAISYLLQDTSAKTEMAEARHMNKFFQTMHVEKVIDEHGNVDLQQLAALASEYNKHYDGHVYWRRRLMWYDMGMSTPDDPLYKAKKAKYRIVHQEIDSKNEAFLDDIRKKHRNGEIPDWEAKMFEDLHG